MAETATFLLSAAALSAAEAIGHGDRSARTYLNQLIEGDLVRTLPADESLDAGVIMQAQRWTP